MLKITTLNKTGYNLKKRILFSVLALPTLFVLFSFYDKGEIGLKKQMPLADKKMESVNGDLFSLNDMKAENGLIVIFSCNTCPFVVGRDDFAGWEVQYNALYEKANAAQIGLVLVNSNEAKRENDDSMDAMKKRAAEKGYQMQYLLDKNSELADAFGAKTTPHVFVFDSKNKLVYKGSIDNTYDNQRDNDIAYLENAITELQNSQKISVNSTPPRGCSIKRVKIN